MAAEQGDVGLEAEGLRPVTSSRDAVPEATKALLRREVNFGCPIRYANGAGCGSPILTYHHFDPPWATGQVHDPDGMIALCPQHHAQADGGSWTKAQLREMKRNPYIDDILKVRWPWQTEGLVMKVGPCLVLGSGSPIRLDGRRILGFRPETIEALGGRTVIFDAEVPDLAGESWLCIRDGWFESHLGKTDDLVFTPQTRQFLAVNSDGSRIALRYQKIPVVDFKTWFGSFLRLSPTAREPRTPEDWLDGCYRGYRNLLEMGLVDRDGTVPVMAFEGNFRSPDVRIQVRGDRFRFSSYLQGTEETFDFHTWIVDEERRAIMKRAGGAEFFSLG